MANLQLPEGYTVRKVGNSLKVVPMRKRRAAIAKEKAMLRGVRIEDKGYGMCWQESASETIKVNGCAFTLEELHNAIQSVRLEEDDIEGSGYSQSRLERQVEAWVSYPFQQWLEKVDGNKYQMRKMA